MSGESIAVMVCSLLFFGLGTAAVITLQILFEKNKLKKKPFKDGDADLFEKIEKKHIKTKK